MDGKVRPLDWMEGRRRAQILLTQQPDASLRDVARCAGISPATVLDVRKRLERGEIPVPEKPKESVPASQAPTATVEKLLRDPSLRSNDLGKGMLRLLHVNAVGADQLPEVAAAVPPHCVTLVVHLARQYAKMWHDFAIELDGRARIIDPL
jgi:transposase-like protein